MWEQIKIDKLIEGKLYDVMDGQRLSLVIIFHQQEIEKENERM